MYWLLWTYAYYLLWTALGSWNAENITTATTTLLCVSISSRTPCDSQVHIHTDLRARALLFFLPFCVDAWVFVCHALLYFRLPVQYTIKPLQLSGGASPSAVTPEGGSTAQEAGHLCRRLWVKIIHSTANHPREKGLVESVVLQGDFASIFSPQAFPCTSYL